LFFSTGAPVWSVPENEETLDLLSRPGAEPVYCSDIHLPLPELKKITEGNTQTTCVLNLENNESWEAVFHLGDEVYTTRRLEVQLATEAGEPVHLEACAQVQVSVSDSTEQVGFQSLWNMPLHNTSHPQSVDLPWRAARWIMLRITPTAKANRLKLAKVRVLGHIGRPRSNYQFKETPAKALDVLQKLKATAGEVKLTEDEQSLFDDARDGRLHSLLLADAALIAAGVHTGAQRGVYLQKLDALAQMARKETAECATPKAKAERLLLWMHTIPLNGGYHPTQSSLATLLDYHSFNCVSATLLFNLLAKELNLDVRALEVPTHVFSILYWGGGVCDVETTSPWGVDPLGNPAIIRRLLAEKKLVYVSQHNPALRREVRDLGLVALIYYNRGVLYNQEKKYAEALQAFFSCLSLDPEFSQAVHNALASLNNWSLALIDEKKYPEAVRVVTAGMELVPQDIGFQDTRRLIYTRWVEETLERGDSENALAILREAARVDPQGEFDRRQALVFTQPAARLVAKKQWARALELAAAGRERLPETAQSELDFWRQETYQTWMRSAMDRQDYAEAAQAMEVALHEDPGNREHAQNLAFVVQTWACASYQKHGRAEAEALLGRYHAQYPGDLMAQAAAGYTGAVLADLRDHSGYAGKALAVVAECEPLLPASREISDLLQGLYEQAAQEQVQKKDFAAALDIYRRAQRRFPQDSHWLKGEDAVRDEWIRALADKSEWEAALALAGQAAGHTSDEAFFAQAIATLAQNYAAADARSRGASGGLDRLVKIQARFPQNSFLPAVIAAYQDQHKLKDAGRPETPPVGAGEGNSADDYDTRGQAAMNKQDWPAATAVYDEALKKYPQHNRLRNNAAAAWDQWAEASVAQKKWDAALSACEQALVRSLSPEHFEKKVVYLVQTGGQEKLQAEELGPVGSWFAQARKVFPQAKALPALITALHTQALAGLSLDKASYYILRGRALIKSLQLALGQSQPDADLIKNWCDRLAQERLDRHAWKDALDMLTAARDLLPTDEHLRSNEVAVWNLWAQTFIQNAQWELAEGIYEQALQRFPQESLLINNLNYCRMKNGKSTAN
jgi:tetratricopeptide (TPR) repeat protein